MLGTLRNLAGIQASDDIPASALARSYLALRARQLGGRPPRLAELAGKQVAYADYPAVVSLFEEIYLRRHYPFRPARTAPFVIDCGANIGVATLFFKTVAPTARVLAFEPEPVAFSLLRENVTRNRLGDVDCRQLAVAADDGRSLLQVPEPAHGGSSLVFGKGLGWAELEVTTARLSQHVTEPVDFLKLDVEGAEDAVVLELANAGALTNVAELAIEHHASDPAGLPRLLGVLAEEGFRYRIAVTSDRFWDEHQLLLVHAFR